MRILLGVLVLATAGAAYGQTCAFSINPTSASFPAAGGSDSVSITLVSGPGSCERTVTSNVSWITISYGSSGTGNGSMGYTVQSNSFTTQRSGTMTIAGQTFTVTQAAGSCSYSISPSSASVSANGGNGSFTLSTSTNSCTWNAASTVDWLTVTTASSGSGTSTVRYTAVPNPTTSSRTGTITAGGQTFTVTQAGVCGFTLSPTAATVTSAGGTGSISVTATASSCAWTAVSGNPDWLTLTGSTAGTGNGTVAYSAAATSSLTDRTGTITIGGVTFSILQSASSCSFTLSSSLGTFTAAGGSGSFYVNSACPWTPVSQADWIQVTSSSNTTGTGTVTFVVAGNTGTQTRTGSITVGNTAYNIRQTGVTCAVTISPNSASVQASGGVTGFAVTTADGCAWTASTTASWLTLSGATGTGAGSVTVTAAANTTAQPRSAIVTTANQQFTVAQDGAQCDYLVSPAQATIAASGGAGTVHIATSCSWSATTTSNWISFPGGASGTGPADLSYNAAANGSSDARMGTVKIGTQTFTLTQAGHSCAYTVSPSSVTIAGRGGKATVQVTGSKGCKWEPVKDQDWLNIDSWSAVDGSGSVSLSAGANSLSVARMATLTVGGQMVAVTQGAMEVIITSTASVLNAASFQAGPVAPGELVTIYGLNVGPATPVEMQLTADGKHIAAGVGGVLVMFGNAPAPLIYASAQQVSVQVPYGVAGKPNTELKVINQGVESNPLTLEVSNAAPAVFTMSASGAGQGAVLNQDNSVNSVSNAAQRGSVVQIFATGEGQTQPAGEDGRIASTPLPVPLGAVTVQIGGQAAQVTYAGAAPGAIAGLFQVNARVPNNAATGSAVPVIVRVGGVSSPAGVTIAVK